MLSPVLHLRIVVHLLAGITAQLLGMPYPSPGPDNSRLDALRSQTSPDATMSARAPQTQLRAAPPARPAFGHDLLSVRRMTHWPPVLAGVTTAADPGLLAWPARTGCMHGHFTSVPPPGSRHSRNAA